MGKYSYDSYSKTEVSNSSFPKKEFPRVGYFYLNENKPSAIVRFDVSSGEDLTIVDVHNVKVGNTWRNVACLRDNDSEPWHKCPLCGQNIKTRTAKVFVRMLEYVYEDGKLVAKPVVWTRYKSFADELISNLNDYGDLRECLFKVSWSKENGRTSYSVKYQPDKGIYTEDAGYVKDFSAFKNFLVNKHSYMERTFEELTDYVATGVMASRKPTNKESSTVETTTTESAKTVATEEVKRVSSLTSEEESNPTLVKRRRYDFIETPADDLEAF